REEWLLLCGPRCGLTVNGRRAGVTGLCRLADRDELRFPRQAPCYFSTERLARVEPLAAGERPVPCARCKAAITGLAVRCPGCGLLHHQDAAAGRECWTYSERCAGCDQPTALDAGFRWTPD